MKNVKGFTLIELLVVLSIVMMLMLLVIPNVTSKLNVIKDKGCDALISMINTQIQLYEINEGYLPGDIDDLVDREYLEKSQTVCPNGKNIYIKKGEAYCND